MQRRQSLGLIAASAAAPALAPLRQLLAADLTSSSYIASNSYPWLTFARRAGEKFEIHSERLLAAIAGAGIRGYEPIVGGAAELDGLGERLEAHGLEMQSIYVNSTLHDGARAEESSAAVIAIAKAAAALGTEVIVTNPAPIRWGGPEDKSDAQLRIQASALDRLGAALRDLGITLAYHNHDAELRQGGREFHHMLTATDPENVKLCLDAHWVFRGCGDSEVAVFDALQHYHGRIVELHLRQSEGGIWTESFKMDGDIDYKRLFDFLGERDIAPKLVLEQAVEQRSPQHLNATEAHKLGRDSLIASL